MKTAPILVTAFALALAACAGPDGDAAKAPVESQTATQETTPSAEREQDTGQDSAKSAAQEHDEEASEMKLSIDGTNVSVEWADNQAIAELKELAANGPITVALSRYGGFEQVGPLGTSLTTSDEQIATEPGDIVLYAGDQISVFYESHSWSYTRLGRITDKTADELTELLGNADVSITLRLA